MVDIIEIMVDTFITYIHNGEMIGEEEHLGKETKILNRLIRVTKEGWEIEADPRHGELIIKELEIEKSKGLSTPGVDEPVPDNDPPLEDRELTQ